jgi:predicted TIM-barrel fold metal-dependent hydrolase
LNALQQQGLTRQDVERYLEIARDIGQDAPIIDIHVHASEIFSGPKSTELADEDVERPALPRSVPAAARLRLDTGERPAGLDQAARNKISAMLFTRSYEDARPDVFLNHMDLAAVRSALLLPVVTPAEGMAEQMARLEQFRKYSSRFRLAYAVPNTVPDDEIADHLQRVMARHAVEAVKIHPNLSRIDLTLDSGMRRIEALHHAASAAALPMIIHGGRSPMLKGEPAESFARLDRLSQIDWSLSDGPVVIAHLGVYGLPPDEVEEDAIRLDHLLERHAHIQADTSGLPYHALKTMLPRLSRERVLFGSDALYHGMWQAVVTLLHVLSAHGKDAETAFATIASRNPGRLFGSED